MWSVAVAVALALANFAVLLPYVVYIFDVMRAETLLRGIRKRASPDLKRAVTNKDAYRRRSGLMTCISQVTDIVFGSISLGDLPVSINGIEVMGRFLADDYLKAKKSFHQDWFQVGHADMPGASDQILAEVNRAHTWVEYTILSSFVDLVGLTQVYRREAGHASAVSARDIGLAAFGIGDPVRADMLVGCLNTIYWDALDLSARYSV